MKLGTNSPDFAPNGDASTKLDFQTPVDLTFLAKDASTSLGSGGGMAVTIEQVVQIFNSYIANTNIYELLDVDDSLDSNASVGDVISWNGSIWTNQAISQYSLPIATSSILGGVKVGSNIDVGVDGTISVTFPSAYSLPIASNSILGGIRVGSGLSIDINGILSTELSNPLSNILYWDGTQYVPYPAKKVSDPGYAYFYESASLLSYPMYDNRLVLDGNLTAGTIESRLYGNVGVEMNPSGILDVQYIDNHIIIGSDSNYRTFISAITSNDTSNPIIIGSLDAQLNFNGENIIIDDSSRLFNINMSNIKLSKGIASKWLALDSSGFITYMNPPASAYIHHTQSALSPTLTGAYVLSSLVVNTEGHTTNALSRLLTLSDLGYDDANIVHISGVETITGVKTFSDVLNTYKIIANSSDRSINIYTTSDYVGILGEGTSETYGYGVVGFSPNIPFQGANTQSAPTGRRAVYTLRGDSAHIVVQNEFGLDISWYLPVLGWVNPDLSEKLSAQFSAVWTDVTQDLENARFEWRLMRDGVLTLQATLDSVGNLTIDGSIYATNIKQNVYTITLPNAGSVAARCSAAVSGVDYPSGWSINAYSLNTNDLEITHNLSRRISSVTIFEVNGATEERQLFANAAYSGVVAPTQNVMRIEALATVTKNIVIHLVFD